MKRLRFDRPGLDSLRLEDVPRPVAGAGQALVQVKAAGLNPSDLTNIKGGFHQTTLPRTPGRDYAGIVVEGPSEFLSQPVWGAGAELGFTTDGTHAEFVTVPAASLVRKPENLSFAQAAAAGVPFVAAWLSLIDAAQVREGETVLIMGAAGSVGKAATQLAAVRGARPLGVDRNNNQNVPQWVLSETGGRGADVCLDSVGGDMFYASLESLAIGGRLAVIITKGDGNVTFNLRDFYHRALRLFGVDSLQVNAASTAAIYRQLCPLFESGALTFDEPEQIPLERGVEAYRQLDSGTARKSVLTPA